MCEPSNVCDSTAARQPPAADQLFSVIVGACAMSGRASQVSQPTHNDRTSTSRSHQCMCRAPLSCAQMPGRGDRRKGGLHCCTHSQERCCGVFDDPCELRARTSAVYHLCSLVFVRVSVVVQVAVASSLAAVGITILRSADVGAICSCGKWLRSCWYLVEDFR